MRRIDVYVDESDLAILEDLPESLSEHIRRAIKDYIIKLRGFLASASESEKKDGE